MLAEMDNRLQVLQQELESVAVPIARRGPEPRRAPRGPDADPLAALSAEHQAPVGHERRAPTAYPAPPAPSAAPHTAYPAPQAPSAAPHTAYPAPQAPSAAPHTAYPAPPAASAAPPAAYPAPPAASAAPQAPARAPERPARPPRGAVGPPRTPPRAPQRQQQQASPAAPVAEPTPGAAPATAAEQTRLEDPGAAPRARAGRRIGTVARSRPVVGPEEASRRAQPSARSSASEAVVRQTILEAEEEARRVVESARDRIAEIGARTRALLEHSLAAPQAKAPAPTAAAAEAPPAPAPRRRRAFIPKPPEQRVYDGAVTVEAGPFADVVQLNEFEDALAAVPGVADVYIRTFERYYAHFEVSVSEPTALIGELQAQIADELRVVDAGDDDLRLEIVRAQDAEAPLG
jgi:hypothetical protein